MTRFALGGKCGGIPVPLGTVCAPAATRSCPSRWATAASPSPDAERNKKCRLFSENKVSDARLSMLLVLGDGLVQVQNQARDAGIRGQLLHIQLLIAGILAHGKKLGGRVRRGSKSLAGVLERIEENRALCSSRPW